MHDVSYYVNTAFTVEGERSLKLGALYQTLSAAMCAEQYFFRDSSSAEVLMESDITRVGEWRQARAS